jgi:hypothetical protein
MLAVNHPDWLGSRPDFSFHDSLSFVSHPYLSGFCRFIGGGLGQLGREKLPANFSIWL